MLKKRDEKYASTCNQKFSTRKLPDEVVPVLLGQGHEGASHHDELNLVHAVSQLLQLFNSEIKAILFSVFKNYYIIY